MAKNKWFVENPEKAREIQKKYYNTHKTEARLRSRAQNLRGKIAFEMLTEKKQINCLKKVNLILKSEIN